MAEWTQDGKKGDKGVLNRMKTLIKVRFLGEIKGLVEVDNVNKGVF